MRTRHLLLAAIVSLAPLSEGFAAEMYKWTDDEGFTQFTQSPPSDRPYEVVNPRVTKPSQPAKEAPAAETNGEVATQEEKEPAKDGAEPQQVAEREEQMKKNCEIAQENLRILESGVRVKVTDEKGEPSFLDDAAKAEKLKQTKAQIKENCG